MDQVSSKCQYQISGLRQTVPMIPLLSISSSEFEEIWKEVKWDTRRVNKTMDLFKTFYKEDLDMNSSDHGDGIQHGEGGLMSNHRLLALLKSIAIVGMESNSPSNIEFFTRNDLCVIMTGIPFIDKKNFLRLMCLLDRSTPHTTTSPAGIARLKLVFSYYDWGWKGYLDEFDWKRLRDDIINFTYYGRLGEKYVIREGKPDFCQGKNSDPVPESLEEGIEELERVMAIKSIKNANSAPKQMHSEGIQLSMSSYKTRDLHKESMTPDISTKNSRGNLRIDFSLFIRLVEYRVIKGTSQILRVELPGKDQEEFICQSIRLNSGSIFLGKLKTRITDEGAAGGRGVYDYDSNIRGGMSNSHLKKEMIQPLSSEAPQMMSSFSKGSQEIKDFDSIEKSKQIINDQIQELDNELHSLRLTVRQSNRSSKSSSIDISDFNNDISSKSAMESIFGPPPEDFHGIFCDKPNDPEDIGFASIVIPTSSTPIRKFRSNKLNEFSSTLNQNKPLTEPTIHHSKSYSNENTSNGLPANVTNIEIGGPPILI